MFSHPLTTVGGLVALAGWIFLLFGVGVGDRSSIQAYNLHLGSIANNVILLGYVLAIAGVIGNARQNPKSDAADVLRDAAEVDEPARKLTEAELAERSAALRQSLQTRRDGLGKPANA